MVRFRTLPNWLADGLSECADVGEMVLLLGLVCAPAACTSATLSDRAILRGAFEEEGEGSDLSEEDATPLHCVRADGGPGSLEVVARQRAKLDAELLLIMDPLDETDAGLFRMMGPKSFRMLPSAAADLAVQASSIGRFPSEDEARTDSGLASCPSLRLSKVDEKAESVEAELKRPLPLREGMLLVLLMLRMDRAAPSDCDGCCDSVCETAPVSLEAEVPVLDTTAAPLEANLDALC